MRRNVSQFVSTDFVKVLTAGEFAISMDGKGAWCDNLFVERGGPSNTRESYLCAYVSVPETRAEIAAEAGVQG